jgi:hypothetical protein
VSAWFLCVSQVQAAWGAAVAPLSHARMPCVAPASPTLYYMERSYNMLVMHKCTQAVRSTVYSNS